MWWSRETPCLAPRWLDACIVQRLPDVLTSVSCGRVGYRVLKTAPCSWSSVVWVLAEVLAARAFLGRSLPLQRSSKWLNLPQCVQVWWNAGHGLRQTEGGTLRPWPDLPQYPQRSSCWEGKGGFFSRRYELRAAFTPWISRSCEAER